MTEQTPEQVTQQRYASAIMACAVASAIDGGFAMTMPEGYNDAASERVLQMFREWASSPDARECQHSPQRADIALWYPHGGVLMCADCFGVMSQEIAGTPEDYRCDLCGRVWEPGQTMHQDKFILQRKPDALGPFATLVMVYAWCSLEPCQEASDG